VGIKVRALVDGVDQFIGIDHHKRRSQVLIKDREGRVIKCGNIETSREALADFLGDGDGLVRSAVFEAGARYRPLARWLRELVDRPLMANPSRLKIISETAYKDDEIDTEKLTDLSMLGLIPEAYICSDEAWDRRMVLRQRVAWVRMRAAVKNRIHGLVDLHPDAEPARPAGTDLFGLMGLSWLEGVELPKVDRQRLDQLLEGYRFLSQQITKSDREVRRIVQADRR